MSQTLALEQIARGLSEIQEQICKLDDIARSLDRIADEAEKIRDAVAQLERTIRLDEDEKFMDALDRRYAQERDDTR